jgi:hypothetical protein
MKLLTVCAVVIAASTFASAVETVYGWGKVRPVAEQAWSAAYEWGGSLIGNEAQTQGAKPSVEGENAKSEGKKS